MERFFYILVIFVLKFNILFCQLDGHKIYRIHYQWINFVTKDTTYHFTLYTEQNGLFHFEMGFADSINNPKEQYYALLDEDSLIIYERNFHFIPEVKNVFDYFHLAEKKINKYTILELSYLLNEINEDQNDTSENIIKVLFPCDQMNFYNEFYFLRIQENKGLSTLYLIKLTSIDISGLKVVRKETINLKQKDYDKLKKKLNKTDSINDIFCMEPSNPFFIEFNQNSTFRRHIITAYCVDKRSNQVLKIYYWLLSRIRLYTDLNCSRELENRVPISF